MMYVGQIHLFILFPLTYTLKGETGNMMNEIGEYLLPCSACGSSPSASCAAASISKPSLLLVGPPFAALTIYQICLMIAVYQAYLLNLMGKSVITLEMAPKCKSK